MMKPKTLFFYKFIKTHQQVESAEKKRQQAEAEAKELEVVKNELEVKSKI